MQIITEKEREERMKIVCLKKHKRKDKFILLLILSTMQCCQRRKALKGIKPVKYLRHSLE